MINLVFYTALCFFGPYRLHLTAIAHWASCRNCNTYLEIAAPARTPPSAPSDAPTTAPGRPAKAPTPQSKAEAETATPTVVLVQAAPLLG